MGTGCRTWLWAGAACAVGLLGGCPADRTGEPEAARELAPPVFDSEAVHGLRFAPEGYPRIDGSTSAHPLGVLVGCTLMNLPTEWVRLPDGTRRLLPKSPDTKQIRAIAVTLAHHGTHQAYVNLIEGRADVILVARRPSTDELRQAKEKGVPLEPVPVARDAFVFILNRGSPVSGLTLEQVRRIYSGKLTNWNQVGGPDGEIHPYQRDRNSGSQELMLSLVMKDTPIVHAPQMVTVGMGGPISRVSRDVRGIGYSVYFYEQFMAANVGLKLCAIDGVVPSYASIRRGTYPLTSDVYAVIRPDLPASHAARRLRDWLVGEEGQEVVKASGYVPAR